LNQKEHYLDDSNCDERDNDDIFFKDSFNENLFPEDLENDDWFEDNG
jgi:hypothetical protein